MQHVQCISIKYYINRYMYVYIYEQHHSGLVKAHSLTVYLAY